MFWVPVSDLCFPTARIRIQNFQSEASLLTCMSFTHSLGCIFSLNFFIWPYSKMNLCKENFVKYPIICLIYGYICTVCHLPTLLLFQFITAGFIISFSPPMRYEPQYSRAAAPVQYSRTVPVRSRTPDQPRYNARR